MLTCPSCGQSNPAGFRLCGMCGTPLGAATELREERKVVTVFFCDLVAFTQQAERLDPEDVRAILAGYHGRVREELERYGGTVEKFVGDAVMALFGAPVAHEDDPERAVRAALAIREAAIDEGRELRVGITTGEALVRLGANPASGEGMASGDVVNTAARLQAAAPVNGILVDAATWRATRQAVDYGAATTVEAKGKAEPIEVWTALQARSRLGVDVAHEAHTPLVGREAEVEALRTTLARVLNRRTSHLLTLIGVPGMGKSRMVWELGQIVEREPALITWRQGRCLAYGDGATLWALGEIVKAQASIHEQDAPEVAAEKVGRAVHEVLDDPADAAWVTGHLRALVGIGTEVEMVTDRRDEAFAAWRRFFEALAEQRPLVMVVEDLHWADDAVLDFIDELVEWVIDVPLLIVGTARPELLERRPGWAGGKLNATTLALSPLTEADASSLVAAMAQGDDGLPTDRRVALLERAGGNPLYLEQLATLYQEGGWSEDVPLSETLNGIIAARLDGLSPPEKGLLHDAAVMGKVFWPGAFTRDPQEAAVILHGLERKGFVRRQRRTSVEGEPELAFAHALVRDVAYGQIPRAERAARHRRTAEWIESLGRPEDHADLLAHHWRSALELSAAAGEEADDLVDHAADALRLAGDRAHGLHAHAAAADRYREALDLVGEANPLRPELLFKLGRAEHHAGAAAEQTEAILTEALEALTAAGDRELAAEAELLLALSAWERGDHQTTMLHGERATALTEGVTSPSAAHVLAATARVREIAGDFEEGLRLARAAVAMADGLGLAEIGAHALATVGMAREDLGDTSGLDDMAEALRRAIEVGSPVAAATGANMAFYAMFDGDLTLAANGLADAVRLAERFGDAPLLRFFRSSIHTFEYLGGDWDPALAGAEAFIAECEAGEPHTNEWEARMVRGSIREARGDPEGALTDHLRMIEVARSVGTDIYLAEGLAHSAATLVSHGELERARSLAEELISLVESGGMCLGLTGLGLVADQLGVQGTLRDAVVRTTARPFLAWRPTFLLILDGDLPTAADNLAAMGSPTLEALVRLHAGERQVAAGRRAEGEDQLRRARDFHAGVRATAYVEQADRLLTS